VCLYGSNTINLIVVTQADEGSAAKSEQSQTFKDRDVPVVEPKKPKFIIEFDWFVDPMHVGFC